MQFTTADIHAAEDFSKALASACSEIMGGRPLSQALAEQGISQSTFKTLLKGLKQNNGKNADQTAEHLHPSWQDDLVADICGREDVYIPKDFEKTLSAVGKQVLDEEQRRIIEFYYKDRMSLGEVAEQLKISESNVSIKKNAAIRALRSRKRDLVLGRDYIDAQSRLRQLYESREEELKWMQQAISFLSEMTDDDVVTADERERAFFKEEGMKKLSDVMGISPSELLSRIVKSAYGYVEALKVPDDERLIYPDTPLWQLELPVKSVQAFERAGINTVGELLALSEDDACDIAGVSARQLLHICWMILGETDKS